MDGPNPGRAISAAEWLPRLEASLSAGEAQAVPHAHALVTAAVSGR